MSIKNDVAAAAAAAATTVRWWYDGKKSKKKKKYVEPASDYCNKNENKTIYWIIGLL